MQLGALCASQEKSPAAGPAFAWNLVSATALASAKQNRFNLVHHMVDRIVSLETESEHSLFHAAEITDTRFSTAFQNPD